MKPVQMIPINDIKPYEKNPRKITDKAVDVVANSIQRFGFKNPILVDKDMVIIAGHTRRQASLKLGLKEVPVIVCDDLSKEQANALRLADNKTGEFSEWDNNILDFEISELQNFGFSMSDFGFDNFIQDENFEEDFKLKEGDREPIITMSVTLSDEQSELVNKAISKMKQSDTFKMYDDDFNKNSNGNALYLVVYEWLMNLSK